VETNVKVLAFAGSLRTDSANKKLAREAVRLLTEHSLARAEFADLRDYPMPIYDGDREQNEGLPDEVIKLGGRIGEADALIVATPEYNGSISSVLKNALDWISRLKPMPVAGKHLVLLSASPGGWGGVRGLWHSRVPFEALGAHVFPQMMSLPGAGSVFDEAGRLTGAPAQQLQNLLRAFAGHAAARIELKAA
jgi:chromate reductase, NAD(P)H dehydrogenase (quinone)